jgi:hypothetical protein
MSDKEHGQKEPKAIEGQAHLEIRATLKATGEVIRQPEEPLFRKGVYLALQQLGDVERGKAAGLLPEDIRDYELVDDPSGLVLSYSAGRLLHGILAIYESTGTNAEGSYRGHFTSSEEYERGGKISQVRIPGLYVMETELLDAYGAARVAGGARYSPAHRETVREAIWELATTKQRIYYTRRERVGKSTKRPTVRITAPLLVVQQVDYFADIAEAREGGDPRATWYKIEPLSLVVDRLVSFHIRSHVALYAQIDSVLAELRATRRGRKGAYHALFIDYIQSLDIPEPKIGLAKLATRIRLGYMAKQRRYSDMRRAVEEAGEVAYKLGYLLEPMIIAGPDDQPMCYLKLNPEQCTRVKAPRELEASGEG